MAGHSLALPTNIKPTPWYLSLNKIPVGGEGGKEGGGGRKKKEEVEEEEERRGKEGKGKGTEF